MRFPSGVQHGSPSSQSPSVICFGSFSPSMPTTKRCVRRSVVQPTLSSL